MSDLSLSTRVPQDTDTERLLLARLLASAAVKTTGTGLASAARTATTSSSEISGQGYKGLIVYLAVSAASGTGGLTVRVRGYNPSSASWVVVTSSSAAITATGAWSYQVGTGGAVTGMTMNIGASASLLPDRILIEVSHGDASSYTYSVGYCLTP